MPATGCQPLEHCDLCGLLVEMERLGIELSGKRLISSLPIRNRPDRKVCPAAKSSRYRPLIRIGSCYSNIACGTVRRIRAGRLERRASQYALVEAVEDWRKPSLPF
jgi:hypothetical protein